MIESILNILTEEPAKIEKALIRSLRILMHVIIAAWIYKYCFGTYQLIALDEYKQLVYYFLSGHVLICVLLYLISHYFIGGIISFVSATIISVVNNLNIFKVADEDAGKFLAGAGIIKKNKQTGFPEPGKNISLGFRIMHFFEGEENQEELQSLKDTYIENVWTLYLLFSIVYVFVIPHELKTTFVNIIFIACLIVILFFYVIFQAFVDYIKENHVKLINSLTFIKVVNKVNTTLVKNGITPVSASEKSKISKFKVFYKNDNEYVLVYGMEGKMVKIDEIEKLLSRKRKEGRIFILIVNKAFIENTDELLIKYFDSFIPIEYTDEKNLDEQLKNTIESIKQ